jgi:hypothetical protein
MFIKTIYFTKTKVEHKLTLTRGPVVDEWVGGGASVAEGQQVLVVVVGLGLHHHRGQLHVLLESSRHLQYRSLPVVKSKPKNANRSCKM